MGNWVKNVIRTQDFQLAVWKRLNTNCPAGHLAGQNANAQVYRAWCGKAIDLRWIQWLLSDPSRLLGLIETHKIVRKKQRSPQTLQKARYSTGLLESLACNLHSFVWQLVILPSACQETHNRFIVPVNKSFRSSLTYYCLMHWEPPPVHLLISAPDTWKGRPLKRPGPQGPGALLAPALFRRHNSGVAVSAWEVGRDRTSGWVWCRTAAGPHKLCRVLCFRQIRALQVTFLCSFTWKWWEYNTFLRV